MFTDAPSEPDDKNSIARTTEEVGKKIKDRKKWFLLVASREEADIVVEVLNQKEGRRSRGQLRHQDRECRPRRP